MVIITNYRREVFHGRWWLQLGPIPRELRRQVWIELMCPHAIAFCAPRSRTGLPYVTGPLGGHPKASANGRGRLLQGIGSRNQIGPKGNDTRRSTDRVEALQHMSLSRRGSL